MALFVELPIDVLIVSVMAKRPEQARMLHGVFGLFAVYSFVWVMGDRWHVLGRRRHVLTETGLALDFVPRPA